MPTLIYILKWALTFYGESVLGLESTPESLRIYLSPQPFYVPKTDYVVFCLPTLAVSLGQMQTVLQGKYIKWLKLMIYGSTIAAVAFVFLWAEY